MEGNCFPFFLNLYFFFLQIIINFHFDAFLELGPFIVVSIAFPLVTLVMWNKDQKQWWELGWGKPLFRLGWPLNAKSSACRGRAAASGPAVRTGRRSFLLRKVHLMHHEAILAACVTRHWDTIWFIWMFYKWEMKPVRTCWIQIQLLPHWLLSKYFSCSWQIQTMITNWR